MTGPAVRSRLLVLRRNRAAAERGRELLEQKHEVLLRELLRRQHVLEAVAAQVTAALTEARTLLRAAQIELGRAVIDAAVLAQRETAPVELRTRTLLGVALPGLRGQSPAFRPSYAPGGTAESLDRAGAAFAALLPRLARLAEEDVAVRNLQRGLAKTLRRLNALDKIVLPHLDGEIHAVTSALEEEERDEAFRHKRWLAAHRARA